MRKVLLLTIAAVFASSLSFAAKDMSGDTRRPPRGEAMMKKEGIHPGVFMGERETKDMGAFRKEMEESRKEYMQLGKEYREEKNEKKRDKIEDKITSKAAQDYDKRITGMEERLGNAKERLSKMETMISEAKKPESKEKHIRRVKEDAISGKGPFSQEARKLDRKGRQERKSGKDFKERKDEKKK